MAVDLALGDFELSGSPLFTPGGKTRVTVFVRGALGTTVPTIGFKYVDVGFRSDDEEVSFEDSSAVALTAAPITNSIPPAINGRSLTYDVT